MRSAVGVLFAAAVGAVVLDRALEGDGFGAGTLMVAALWTAAGLIAVCWTLGQLGRLIADGGVQ